MLKFGFRSFWMMVLQNMNICVPKVIFGQVLIQKASALLTRVIISLWSCMNQL
nr:MAG TPA: hypothetical protein [Caudoviricetes sp.]